MEDAYQRLLELLAKEKFPHRFTFKFVGKTSAPFDEGVAELRRLHPKLILQSRRQSKNQKHTSFTFTLDAEGPEPIIATYRSINAIPDILFIL